MSAVLFHPALGRFSAPDEVGSATDSDSHQPHRRRQDGMTRREEGDQFSTGRRHRRYLNANLSESEFSLTDDDSDEELEDRKIFRFEWKQSFIAAGTNFFESEQNAPLAQKEAAGAGRARRRMPKMQRRLRSDLVTNPTQDEAKLDEEDEDDGAVIVESKHAVARRMRNARFGALTSQAQAAKAAIAASSTSPTSASSVQPTATTAEESADEDTAQAASADASGLQRISIPETSRRVAGQEAASAIFSTVQQSLRHALRKVGEAELLFLLELEDLLVAYKNGRPLQNDRPTHFERLAYATRAGDETEVTSDEDVCLVDVVRTDPPLVLAFRNPFERYLGHGCVQFHQLVARSHNSQTGVRVTHVRCPKAGVLLHNARLVPYIIKKTARKVAAAPSSSSTAEPQSM